MPCSFSYLFEEQIDTHKRHIFVEFPHGVRMRGGGGTGGDSHEGRPGGGLNEGGRMGGHHGRPGEGELRVTSHSSGSSFK